MHKWINPGRTTEGTVYLKVEIKDTDKGPKLSISGVVGPERNGGGNCTGSCGQCQDTLREDGFTLEGGWTSEQVAHLHVIWERWHMNNMRPECEHQRVLGWRELGLEKVPIFHWRLAPEVLKAQSAVKHNALKAITAGQSVQLDPANVALLALPWDRTTETDAAPGVEYRPCPAGLGSGPVEYKALGWLRLTEHSRGLLCRPCPTCGYQYGSAWLYEPLPPDVVAFLESLPSVAAPAGWDR